MGGSTAAWNDLSSAICSDGAPSARNLLVTVFGDTVAPRSSKIAVSVRSLAALLDRFGVSERLVRTSLSRLVADGVLAANPVGRRSFYSIAPQSTRLFVDADRRIYTTTRADWDGRWTLVMIDGLDATPEVRAELRNRIADRGFGIVAPNVLVSALARPAAVADLFVDDEVGRAVVFRVDVADVPGTVDGRQLTRRAHHLDELRRDYRAFLQRFEPYSVEFAAALEPDMAFKLRTLLVSSYRRVVLDDPALPTELLPERWAGDEARSVAAELYAGCFDAAEVYVESELVTSDGDLAPNTVTAQRFRVHADY